MDRLIQFNTGRKMSAAARKKIAASKRGGKGNPGKRSPEFCAKISAIRLGKKPAKCFENIVSDKTKLEIVEIYLSGKGLRALKKIYRTKSDVIRHILTDAGVEIRRPTYIRARRNISGAVISNDALQNGA